MKSFTIRVPFSLKTLRGLYVTINSTRKFLGRFSARGYSSFGFGLMTVQWVP